MQVLIVEDEILLAKQLSKLLLEVAPEAQVVATTQGVQQTVEWLQQHGVPDLILMDIEIADGQSFDIFKRIPIKAPVIFTTAYDEYALQAFKVNSIDYLLKPIRKNELQTALAKFRSLSPQKIPDNKIEKLLLQMQQWKEPASYRSRFLVKLGQKMISIDCKDVSYFYSEGGYSFLRTHDNQKFILDYTLDELERSLHPNEFFRANRQCIISQRCVVAIHPWLNQKLKVEIIPAADEHVVISREKSHDFKKWMGS